ncbi:MAG: imidazoleglycerol-phosphate dehydratase HisB [Lachnospiraceae bacterium]|nr:imidazoleglycerol-phosphate dehydratase HisB [Lachnospiraceae bacterium]
MRTGNVKRVTNETDIEVEINLDGNGDSTVSTGIGAFDHMLAAFAKHGFFDLNVKCKGDLFIDCHHTIEDCGIALGEAIDKALGNKEGINRYGCFTLPMDETLVLSAIDLCGRPYLNFDVNFTVPSVGDFDTEMAKEFFYAVSYSSKMNLHIKELAGENNHHKLEACFKAFAKALCIAVTKNDRINGVLSTKGTL